MNEKVQYTLENTIVGKPERKEPTLLRDSFGNTLKVPWAPKNNCRRCHGRGFVGTDPKTNQILVCRKCYPWEN